LGARDDQVDWDTTGIASPAGIIVTPDPFSASRSFDSTDFRVSGYAGYNWQFTNWLIGVEGDFGWADNRTTVNGIPGTFGVGGLADFVGIAPGVFGHDFASVKTDWDASIRGRIGWLPAPNFLLYATGGVSWINVEATATCDGALPSWCVLARGQRSSDTLTGWTVGAGVEWMFAPSWIARAEYRFSDYGDFTPIFFPSAIDQVNARVSVQTQTAYVGVSYLFNWH